MKSCLSFISCHSGEAHDQELLPALDLKGFDFTAVVNYTNLADGKVEFWQEMDLPETGWFLRREVMKNPGDLFQLGVYADWLEDNGREEAMSVRNAWEFLTDVKSKHVKVDHPLFYEVAIPGYSAAYPEYPMFIECDVALGLLASIEASS